MDRWRGRVAVVTGASSGIGIYIAELLARNGLKVAALARRIELLEESAQRLAAHQSGSFYPIKCDLRKDEDIVNAFEKIENDIGPVAILINNAGVLISERIVDGSTENFRQILDVNVLAVAICIREATKSMRKHNIHGHIINVNSVAGHDAGSIKVPLSLYCASKYAVTGLTESVRNELTDLKAGTKITSISPGAVRTSMIVTAGLPEPLLDRVQILDPKDIAEAVIYALSTPPHVQVNELTITPLDEWMHEPQSKTQ